MRAWCAARLTRRTERSPRGACIGGLAGILGFAAVALGAILPGTSASAQSAASLVENARRLAAACDLTQALPAAERALLAVRDEFGSQSTEMAFALDDVGKAARSAGKLDRAVSAGAQAVEMIAATAGAQALERAVLLGNLGASLTAAGRIADADAAITEALEIARASGLGPDRLVHLYLLQHELFRTRDLVEREVEAAQQAAALARTHTLPEEAGTLIRLSDALRRSGRLAEARAEADQARRFGESPALLLGDAQLALDMGGFDAAERLVVRAIAGGGAQSCDRLLLASAYILQGNIRLQRWQGREARESFLNAIEMYDASGLSAPHRVAFAYHGLASAMRFAGDFTESDLVFNQAATLFKQAFGASSIQLSRVLAEQAMMLADMGASRRAVDAAREALAIASAIPDASMRDQANAHAALGVALRRNGEVVEAADNFRMAVALFEQAGGANSPDIAPGLIELGGMAIDAGDAPGALRDLLRAEGVLVASGADGGLNLVRTRTGLARANFLSGRVAEAAQLASEAVSIVESRLRIEAGSGSDRDLDEIRRSREAMETALWIAADLRPASRDDEAVFAWMQLALMTRTGRTLAQSAERLGAASPDIRSLLTERQARAREWRDLDRAGLSTGLIDATGDATRSRLERTARLRRLEDEIRELDQTLQGRLAVSGGAVEGPVTLSAIRRHLRADETLVMYVVGASASQVMLVSREGLHLEQLEAGADDIRRLAARMLSSMDMDAWASAQKPSRFDVAAAHDLYRILLAPVASRLPERGRLLFVLDGPLSGIPIPALVTSQVAAPVTRADYGRISWFGSQSRVISVLPSVESLVALRGVANTSRGDLPMLGVGDPVLGKAVSGASRGIRVAPISDGAPKSASPLARLPSLPETRQELQRISRAVGGSPQHLLLGAKATEADLRTRDLTRYRWVVFATHGVLGGELPGRMEPGLILTPPAVSHGQDDGYLSASEIASLDLDADIVILSACNTAGPDGTPDAEGLSGLARAFIAAGARGVLVTHWKVDSEAAVEFMTRMAERYAAGADVSEAVAGARDDVGSFKGYRWSSHPAFWAPFFYVGV